VKYKAQSQTRNNKLGGAAGRYNTNSKQINEKYSEYGID
jgi:hypothetical protein